MIAINFCDTKIKPHSLFSSPEKEDNGPKPNVSTKILTNLNGQALYLSFGCWMTTAMLIVAPNAFNFMLLWEFAAAIVHFYVSTWKVRGFDEI